MKAQREIEWTRLDNASKIFPSTYSDRDPKVFRFACELDQEVDPEILQEALDLTVEHFPLYSSVLRRGMFWYYLESSDIRPLVEEESHPLCAPIYLGHKRNLLFRVFYYRRRINLEIFHVLTDGTGALQFLQSLVKNYLFIKYNTENTASPTSLPNAAISRQMADSFEKYFSGGNPFAIKKKNIGKRNKNLNHVYHIRGARLSENRTRLIEGVMSARAVLTQAHNHHTTLTRFIAALLVYSIYKEMPTRKLKRPVVLSVPINLRQFFLSETTRNFFSTINVSYNFKTDPSDFPAVLKAIGEDFEKELTQEQLNYKLNRFMHLAQNPFIRVMPLQLKNFLLRIGSRFADARISSGISNIGQIAMPEAFASHIRQFSVCTKARGIRVTLCSFGDKLVLSFTSPFRETDIQRNFFNLLTEMGVDIEISANL